MTFTFDIKTPTGEKPFAVEPGTSLYFLGANGGGKTRLAVKIEETLGERAHRIAAHRALALNPEVDKISERQALAGLRIGHRSNEAVIQQREGHRWGGKAATLLLSDYNYVVQALFAEQANTSLKTHQNARARNGAPVTMTKFEQLI